jgi:transcriptional regulator of acetoin/glycerol metabolism
MLFDKGNPPEPRYATYPEVHIELTRFCYGRTSNRTRLENARLAELKEPKTKDYLDEIGSTRGI